MRSVRYIVDYNIWDSVDDEQDDLVKDGVIRQAEERVWGKLRKNVYGVEVALKEAIR